MKIIILIQFLLMGYMFWCINVIDGNVWEIRNKQEVMREISIKMAGDVIRLKRGVE